MATNDSVVFSGISGLIRNNVLMPLASYYGAKGMQLNVDEMMGVLKLPASSSSAPPMPSAPGFPPAFGLVGFGNAPMPVAPPKGKGTKKKGPSQPVPEEEQCVYITIRGNNKGKRCDNRKEAGTHLCSGCKGKQAAQNQVRDAIQQGRLRPVEAIAPAFPGAGTTGFPGAPAGFPGGAPAGFPGGAPTGFPGGATGFPSGAPTFPGLPNFSAPPPSSGQTMQIRPLSGGYFYDATHNLALRKGEREGEYVCCGMYDQRANQIHPLTPEKIALCNQLRLSYIDPSKPDSTVSGQTFPPAQSQMPAMPPSAAPQLPSMPPAFPPMPSLPGAMAATAMTANAMSSGGPSIQIPSFGLPSVPAVSEMGKADDPVDEDDEDEGE